MNAQLGRMRALNVILKWVKILGIGSLIRLYRHQQIAVVNGRGRNDGLVHWDVVAVAFFHFLPDGWVGQVKVPEFFKFADFDSGGALIYFPDEFGAVNVIVAPLEGQVVVFAFEIFAFLLHFLEHFGGEDFVRGFKPFDDIMPVFPTGNPLVEGRFLNGLNGFKDVKFSIFAVNDPGMGILRLGGKLYGFALPGKRGLKNNVAVLYRVVVGELAYGLLCLFQSVFWVVYFALGVEGGQGEGCKYAKDDCCFFHRRCCFAYFFASVAISATKVAVMGEVKSSGKAKGGIIMGIAHKYILTL